MQDVLHGVLVDLVELEGLGLSFNFWVFCDIDVGQVVKHVNCLRKASIGKPVSINLVYQSGVDLLRGVLLELYWVIQAITYRILGCCLTFFYFF